MGSKYAYFAFIAEIANKIVKPTNFIPGEVAYKAS